MKRKSFKLGEDSVTLPRGTRVTLRTDLRGEDLSQGVHRHYAGFLRGMEREYEIEAKDGTRRAKRLLYAYRVALTGVHLLRTGELVTNVLELHERHGFPNVPQLAEIKRSREAGTISERDEPRYLEDFPRLEEALQDALVESVLPARASQ